MAIVDTLQDVDVEYGEVLVYELTRDVLRNDAFIECYTATLRFTDFAGKIPQSRYSTILTIVS